MKRELAFVGLALVGFGLCAVRAQTEQPNKVADFMRLKLTHAQAVLEGIAREDFDGIAIHSQALSLLSQEANWKVLQTEDYLEHSIEFRRTADAITEAAKKKNLDGAALAYVDMTMKCVNCHKYVRGVRMATK